MLSRFLKRQRWVTDGDAIFILFTKQFGWRHFSNLFSRDWAVHVQETGRLKELA